MSAPVNNTQILLFIEQIVYFKSNQTVLYIAFPGSDTEVGPYIGFSLPDFTEKYTFFSPTVPAMLA